MPKQKVAQFQFSRLEYGSAIIGGAMQLRIFFGVIGIATTVACIALILGVIGGHSATDPFVAMREGARNYVKWARHDDWGIETTFFLFQLIFISGLALVIRWGLKAHRDVQDTEEQIRNLASVAANRMATFLDDLDQAHSEAGDQNQFLKDIAKFDIKEDRSRTIEATESLVRKIQDEIEVWRRVNGKLGNLPSYRTFAGSVLTVLHRAAARTAIHQLYTDISQHRKDLDEFVKYQFKMHNGDVPGWVTVTPIKTSTAYLAYREVEG